MAALRRLLLGLMLIFAGALVTPSPSIEPHSPIDIVVDTLAPQAQAITSSQRALLRRGVSPIASWDASTGTLTSLAALVTSTRTSNAMMFDSAGKLTYAPNNLLTYSNTFSNVIWNPTSLSISSGVSDPFGGSSASTLTATGANAFVQQNVTLSGDGIAVVWARRRTGSGTVLLGGPNGSTAIAVTSSWQQFYRKATGIGSSYLFLQINTSGDAVDFYAATLSAVTYETTPRTADQVITASAAAYYGPRIDYDPTTLAVKGLLIESSRTNIVLQNRDLTNAAWTKGATITVAKDQTGIDGVANSASSITGGAVSATNTVLQSITLASSTRSQSAWVKRITGSGTVNMTTDGGTTWNAITLTSSWTLVQFSQAAVTNPNVGFQVTTLNDKIAVDFVQNETGTFATSSLQTAASSVTRAADALAAAAYSSNPAIIQYRDQATGTRARKKLTTFSSISSETAEWIEAIRVYPVGTSSAYLDAHLTVDGAW